MTAQNIEIIYSIELLIFLETTLRKKNSKLQEIVKDEKQNNLIILLAKCVYKFVNFANKL